MKVKSTAYPSALAVVEQGKIVAPQPSKAVEVSVVEPEQKNAGGIPAPFNRVLDSGARVDKHPVPMPMQQSVWVMRAIKTVSDPICAVPLEFHTGPKGKQTTYTNDALEAFWEDPALQLDYEEFIDACVGWYSLKGEVFWLLDDSWLSRGARKSKMIVAKPDSMREIVQDGVLMGWEYQDVNGGRHLLIEEQVIHIKSWNPYSKWRGLAPYLAARIATEADYLQGMQASNLARNNGDQGMIVTAKNATLTDDQQRQIASQLMMKRQAALRGDNRPIFLSADIDVKAPTIQSPDADFIAGRLENRHEIAIAFGVPPSMFDVVASYSIGSASDLYRLIENTCVPTSRRFTKPVATVSKRLLGLDPDFLLRAKFNFDQHSVMQAAKRERFDSAVKLWSTGMPMKTASEVLALDLPEYEGWDQGYLPFNVSPVDAQVDPTTSTDFSEVPPKPVPSPEEDEENDPVTQLARLFKQKQLTCERVNIETKAADERLWKKHIASRQPAITRYRTKFTRVLTNARGAVLAKLAKHGEMTGKSIVVKDGAAAGFMFDLHTFAAEFKAAMDSAGRSAYDDAGQQLNEEIGLDDPWVSPPTQVKEFLATRDNRLRDVPQEVFDTIKSQLTEGIDKGESISELSSRVRSSFNEIGSGRGKTIAMTETSAAYGTARHAAMKSAGVPSKQWLTSHNDNVRPAHAEAEGQIRAVDEPFNVDGEELDFPGDPEGSPGNVINCHCVAIPIMGPADGSKEDDDV